MWKIFADISTLLQILAKFKEHSNNIDITKLPESHEKIIIEGGRRLSGSIPISGAKNSCLTLMPLVLLSGEQLILQNAPFLSDVDTMKKLLEDLGCVVDYDKSKKQISKE